MHYRFLMLTLFILWCLFTLLIIGVGIETECPNCGSTLTRSQIGMDEIDRNQILRTERRRAYHHEYHSKRGPSIPTGYTEYNADVPYNEVNFLKYLKSRCTN